MLTTELADSKTLGHAEATKSAELALAVAVVAVAGETLLVRQEQVFAYVAEVEHAETYHGSPVAFLQSEVAVAPLLERVFKPLSVLHPARSKILAALLRFELRAETVVLTVEVGSGK